MTNQEPKQQSARIVALFEHRVEGTSALRISRERPADWSDNDELRSYLSAVGNEVRIRRVRRAEDVPTSLSVVEAADRFHPESVSTVSITVASDKTIDHRMDVRVDHSGFMSRALRALAKKLDGED